jgi:hypothetical protein
MKNWWQVVSIISITLTFVTRTITDYLLGISNCSRLKLKTSKLVTVVLQNFLSFFIGLQLSLIIMIVNSKKLKHLCKV